MGKKMGLSDLLGGDTGDDDGQLGLAAGSAKPAEVPKRPAGAGSKLKGLGRFQALEADGQDEDFFKEFAVERLDDLPEVPAVTHRRPAIAWDNDADLELTDGHAPESNQTSNDANDATMTTTTAEPTDAAASTHPAEIAAQGMVTGKQTAEPAEGDPSNLDKSGSDAAPVADTSGDLETYSTAALATQDGQAQALARQVMDGSNPESAPPTRGPSSAGDTQNAADAMTPAASILTTSAASPTTGIAPPASATAASVQGQQEMGHKQQAVQDSVATGSSEAQAGDAATAAAAACASSGTEQHAAAPSETTLAHTSANIKTNTAAAVTTSTMAATFNSAAEPADDNTADRSMEDSVKAAGAATGAVSAPSTKPHVPTFAGSLPGPKIFLPSKAVPSSVAAAAAPSGSTKPSYAPVQSLSAAGCQSGMLAAASKATAFPSFKVPTAALGRAAAATPQQFGPQGTAATFGTALPRFGTASFRSAANLHTAAPSTLAAASAGTPSSVPAPAASGTEASPSTAAMTSASPGACTPQPGASPASYRTTTPTVTAEQHGPAKKARTLAAAGGHPASTYLPTSAPFKQSAAPSTAGGALEQTPISSGPAGTATAVHDQLMSVPRVSTAPRAPEAPAASTATAEDAVQPMQPLVDDMEVDHPAAAAAAAADAAEAADELHSTLAADFSQHIKRLEAMLLEAQDMQEQVLHMRVKAAITSNRLVRLNNPANAKKLALLHQALKP